MGSQLLIDRDNRGKTFLSLNHLIGKVTCAILFEKMHSPIGQEKCSCEKFKIFKLWTVSRIFNVHYHRGNKMIFYFFFLKGQFLRINTYYDTFNKNRLKKRHYVIHFNREEMMTQAYAAFFLLVAKCIANAFAPLQCAVFLHRVVLALIEQLCVQNKAIFFRSYQQA